MKKFSLFNLLLLSLIVLVNSIFVSYAQDKNNFADVKNWVDSQRYVFEVQSVTPMSGRTRQLTPGYQLKISKDTIISILPYYGRAYNAPINASDAGINFTSTKFDYTASPRKKGGWDVVIKPGDVSSLDKMMLIIFENGTTSLSITSNDRQPISYNGYVRSVKAK